MDYEVKKKVFTSFFSTKGSKQGTGLGLLVTRRVTQEHGGSVVLESEPGKGATFRLLFPRRRLPPGSSPDKDRSPGGNEKSTARPGREDE
jgi:signal transduction histidine kinase